MAIALVSNGAVASGSPSAAPAFGASTGAGHLLVAEVYCGVILDGISVFANCSDGTWTLQQNPYNSASAAGTCVIWYKTNCGAGETAPTFNASNNQGTTYALLAEFSGVATTSPLAASNGAAANGLYSLATPPPEVGDLVVANGVESLSKAGTTTTSLTYNNGAPDNDMADNDASSITIPHYRFSYGLVTGTSNSQTANFGSTSMNNSAATSAAAMFKVAAAVQQPFTGDEHRIARRVLMGARQVRSS